MRKSLYGAIAAAGFLSILTIDAQALPAPRLTAFDELTTVVPVADGCGRGRHFSRRLRRCVWNW